MINLAIIWNVVKIIGDSTGHNFSHNVDTISAIGKQILRPSYLKIRLDILDSLIIFKRICMSLIQILYGQFRHFMVVKIHL